ncbi:MAG: SDR family NAD(P)-dependent oxidoreductase [Clostridium sp.]
MNDNYTLITGGTEGIGYELAKLYSKEGYNLIIVSRNVNNLERVKLELEDRYKNNVKIVSLDLSIHSDRINLIEYVEKNKLIVDNLINNAGIGGFDYFYKEKIDKHLSMNSINIDCLTHLTHYFLAKMVDRKSGGILNVASTAAFSSGPKMANYYATKAYVLSLTEAIHEEVKCNNIRVSCLCPGPVGTGFQSKAGIEKSEGAKAYVMSAQKVAEIGFKEFSKGKLIIIPGWKNKIIITLNKFIPRWISRKIVLKTNSK